MIRLCIKLHPQHLLKACLEIAGFTGQATGVANLPPLIKRNGTAAHLHIQRFRDDTQRRFTAVEWDSIDRLIGLIARLGGGYRKEIVCSAQQLVGAFEGINKLDRKSTRLNSSHVKISYAVFCLKKK